MNYQKIVSKKTPPYYYMRVQLDLDSENPPEMTSVQFKALILVALNIMFGEVGQASIQTDVLQYKPQKRTAILRVLSSEFVKLWGALTICGEYAGYSCAFRVKQVSSSLMGLSANSRTFSPKPVSPTTDR